MNDHPASQYLAICAGIGGLELGLRIVVPSLRAIGYVEVEAFCQAILVQKMEEGYLDPAPVFSDLHDFDWEMYRDRVTILGAGFPCQPFSTSGRRKSTEDRRHLWPLIREGLGIVRPRIAFFENVDGIASARSPGRHSVLHHVLGDLEELGYRATAGCFSAAEVGAPHIRRRWFILALDDSIGMAAGGDAGTVSSSTTEMEGQVPQPSSTEHTSGDAGSGDRLEDGEGGMWSLAERSAYREPPNDCTIGWCPRTQRCIEDCDECECGDLAQRLADPGCGRQSCVGEAHDQDGSDASGDNADGCSAPMADPDGTRSETGIPEEARECEGMSVRQEPDHPSYRGRWPAGPGEPQFDWEPPRTQQRMGRSSNGVSTRVDRLRALGNACSPPQVALAFSCLFEELTT